MTLTIADFLQEVHCSLKPAARRRSDDAIIYFCDWCNGIVYAKPGTPPLCEVAALREAQDITRSDADG